VGVYQKRRAVVGGPENHLLVEGEERFVVEKVKVVKEVVVVVVVDEDRVDTVVVG
jgi:hypothetical protein